MQGILGWATGQPKKPNGFEMGCFLKEVKMIKCESKGEERVAESEEKARSQSIIPSLHYTHLTYPILKREAPSSSKMIVCTPVQSIT